MVGDCDFKLQNYLEQLRSIRQKGTLEDSVRDAFLYFLREAFPRLQLTEPFELEKCVTALRVHGGFANALYGDLIFEFKRRLDDNARTDDKEQLKHYLPNQPRPDRYFGILTDGENLEVYPLRDCEKRLVPTANDVALRFGERSPTFWYSLRLLRSIWQRAKKRTNSENEENEVFRMAEFAFHRLW